MEYESVLPPCGVQKLVRLWLEEDTPSFDVGGLVVGSKQQSCTLFAKADGVLAGKPFFEEVFKQVGDCTVTWEMDEGSLFTASNNDRKIAAHVVGPARKLLLGERAALNMLARASGIALRCRRLADLADKNGWKGRVAGTRKTTPLFRLVEKYAMLVGGCDTHRMDLSSMVMLKDNHIWSHGSITAAVEIARKTAGFSMKIEVECGSEKDAEEAILAGADVVMLDNFGPKELHQVAKRLKQKFKGEKQKFLVEASGGITIDTIEEYFGPDIDVISMGSITQGCPFVDYSLKIDH